MLLTMPPPAPGSRSDLDALLTRHFGFQTFRPHQREIVESLLAGQDVLALLPTGGGKSLCYQLPAVAKQGLTVVISPLIALMKDQVDSLAELGVLQPSSTRRYRPTRVESVGTICTPDDTRSFIWRPNGS